MQSSLKWHCIGSCLPLGDCTIEYLRPTKPSPLTYTALERITEAVTCDTQKRGNDAKRNCGIGDEGEVTLELLLIAEGLQASLPTVHPVQRSGSSLCAVTGGQQDDVKCIVVC